MEPGPKIATCVSVKYDSKFLNEELMLNQED